MNNTNTNYVNYLIELSQSGRRNAYKDLCEINLRHVYTVIYHLVPDELSARRLTQQAFLIAWSEIKSFNPQQSFAVWIKNIAIHYTVKMLKFDSTYRNILDNRIKTGFSEKNLEYYLCRMETEERIILVLNDIEGFSYAEIQKFLPELIPDEIKTKLVNAREFLMAKLKL